MILPLSRADTRHSLLFWHFSVQFIRILLSLSLSSSIIRIEVLSTIMTTSTPIQTVRSQPHVSFESEETKQNDTDSLLSRSSSYTNTNQQRRRRTDTKLSSPPPSPSRQRPRSFSRDIGHAASETYLVTRLTIKLLRYLGYNSLSYFLRSSILLFCFL